MGVDLINKVDNLRQSLCSVDSNPCELISHKLMDGKNYKFQFNYAEGQHVNLLLLMAMVTFQGPEVTY